jgi:sugar porter (SP) family MFS transporter
LKGASPLVKTCAFFASLDALLLGYDIGVVSGIIVFIQDQFKLSLLETGNFAAALNAAAIVGALVSGWIADRFGRKPSLFVSSLMFTTGSFLMAGANTYRGLVLGRYVQGYGVGAGLLISPMFISEIAPPQFRGSLVTLSEVSLSLGVLLAYVGNVALAGLPNQWRWMLRLGAVPGVLLTLRIAFLPESPRYLVSKGKHDEARDVLRMVMDPAPPEEVEETLEEIETRNAEESSSSWKLLLAPATLTAVLIGAVLAALQHAVGIESIIYHSPIIFEKAGVAAKRVAMMGTVGMGVIKLVFETYALLNVDRIGRRPLLLVGSVGLTGALLVLGTALRSKVISGVPGVTSMTYVIFGAIAAYTALHALSFGPITWLVLAEIFPSKVKGKAMGIATTVNRLTSYVAALSFLTMCDKLQWGGTFFVYAGFAAFAVVFYALLVPETTGMHLEEITPLFAKPGELVRTNLRGLQSSK